MNRLLVLVACLLFAAAPLRGYALPDCCPPERSTMAHAQHAHGAQADTQAQPGGGDDAACTRLACALHCAGASALVHPSMPALPAAANDWRRDPAHTPPPAMPRLAPERPPRRLPS
ncbi:MAG: hypothetical protein AB7I32_05740 [Gammaproteobacteria bacterium]